MFYRRFWVSFFLMKNYASQIKLNFLYENLPIHKILRIFLWETCHSSSRSRHYLCYSVPVLPDNSSVWFEHKTWLVKQYFLFLLSFRLNNSWRNFMKHSSLFEGSLQVIWNEKSNFGMSRSLVCCVYNVYKQKLSTSKKFEELWSRDFSNTTDKHVTILNVSVSVSFIFKVLNSLQLLCGNRKPETFHFQSN